MGNVGSEARTAILFKDELHPAHAGFADVLGAERVRFPGSGASPIAGTVLEDVVSVARRARSLPADHDVYLSEDAVGLYAAPLLASRTDAPHVYLAANHRTFGFKGYDFGPAWDPRALARRADRAVDVAALRRVLSRYVDGVIAVSELMARNVARVAPDVPVRIAHPYVEPSLFDRLGAVEPVLEANRAVFVGKNRPHKGVDMLVRAWPQVRERHPDATLEIVGEGHPPDREVDGVTVRGYVDDLAGVYRNASLYVHPARYDPFAVTVLEAMRAGVPAVGTSACGVSPYVAAVDPALRCDPTPAAIASAVSDYFELDPAERRSLSATARAAASDFDPERSERAFAEQFDRLLADVEERD